MPGFFQVCMNSTKMGQKKLQVSDYGIKLSSHIGSENKK